MGSSSKTAPPPEATPAPANSVPYGQASPTNYSWTNVLPNPATGDPIRAAQLTDPTWQSSVPMQTPTTAAAPAQDPNELKALLAAMMSRPQQQDRTFGSSFGGGGLGGNYSTSGGGMSTGSYGRTASGVRSSAHAGGGGWGNSRSGGASKAGKGGLY